jgi:hypothetical protein
MCIIGKPGSPDPRVFGGANVNKRRTKLAAGFYLGPPKEKAGEAEASPATEPVYTYFLLRAENGDVAFRHAAVPVTGDDFPVIGRRSLQAGNLPANGNIRRLRSTAARTAAADKRGPHQDHEGRNKQDPLPAPRSADYGKAEEDESHARARIEHSRGLAGGRSARSLGRSGTESRVRGHKKFIADRVSVGVRGRHPLHQDGSVEIPLQVRRVFCRGLARRIVALANDRGAAYLYGDRLFVRIIGWDVKAFAGRTAGDNASVTG